ncbi:MAG: nuclear transport factor 2 family protein [Gammaproteobacteria bacterium]|nr:nuclear transport factor 2 family protein [Gammaproteobacteria bacterium]
MVKRLAGSMLCLLVLSGFSVAASAQTWSAEQQEVWAVEEAQWKLAAAKDLSWVDTMVHPSVSYWETDQPVPQNKASLLRWNRYSASYSTVLEQEIRPISIVVTGNVAVVNYVYQIAREDDKKKRETVQGRYMDVLVKDKGKWLFLAWSGGDDPKK